MLFVKFYALLTYISQQSIHIHIAGPLTLKDVRNVIVVFERPKQWNSGTLACDTNVAR